MKPKYIIFSRSQESDKKYNVDDKYLKLCPQAKIYKTFKMGSFGLECTFNSPQEIKLI